MTKPTDRRSFLNATLLGAAGAGGALCSIEERILLAALQEGQAATPTTPAPADSLPTGRIGNVTMSRMIMGGNLIGGWAHARDLIYVSRLFKAYNTEEKIFETLALAERMGIDTIQIDPACLDVVEKYRREGGKIQMMICMHPHPEEARVRDQVKMLVDRGAVALYSHGEVTDRLVMGNQLEVVARSLDIIRDAGVPAGVGSHSLETPKACRDRGVKPDYYVKTYHLDRYWSATPEEYREEWCWYKGFAQDRRGYRDNMFCLNPEETVEFFADVEEPWVAFKVLAAGALTPQTGFSSAFRAGADFIIVGMFDFQVAQDVAIVKEALEKNKNRPRPWRA